MFTSKQPLYRHIASSVDARHRCERNGMTDARLMHESALNFMADECLPSGAGVDNGTGIEWDASTGEKLVLRVSYHHMHSNGFYDGWADYPITVRPSLIHGLDLKIGGRDRNDVKEYLADLYRDALQKECAFACDSTGHYYLVKDTAQSA